MNTKIVEAPTTGSLKKLAENLDKKLHTGPCERAPKRCFEPEQRGAAKGYAEWDATKMCDSCSASWHAAQIVIVLTRKHLAERQAKAENGAAS